MKIGSMLGDLLQSLFKRPVTQMYPFKKTPAPERLRGRLFWDPEKCVGCQLCIKDCPANAIELVVLDKVNKRFVMRYHADRCTYCAQCVITCRFKCMNMSNEVWEEASANKQPFEVYYGKDADVEFLLERAARPEPDEPCPEE